MTLSERLKRLREKNDWTQEQTADRFEVPRSRYVHYEAGRHEPRGKAFLDRLKDLERDPAPVSAYVAPGVADDGTRYIEMLLAILRSGHTRAIRMVRSSIEQIYDLVKAEASPKPERRGRAV